MDVGSSSQGTLQSSGEDSSKSTVSKPSGEKDQDDKELDLTKDNAASPIDMECHIQQERITKILDEAIYKTKLAICLPKLVQNFKILNSELSPQHMDDLIFIFEQYDNPLFSASLLNMAAMEDIKAGDVSLRNRLNPELGHLLYIMNSYPSLAEPANTIIDELRANYPEDDQSKPPQPTLEYLMAMEKVREIMIKQMETTAAEELSGKLYVRKLEVSNAKLIAQIKELTDTIRIEHENFMRLMQHKNEEIASLEKELEVLTKAADAMLKKKVLDSERQMALLTRTHVVKNAMLKDEEGDIREGYNQLLRQHLIDEKAQRGRRFKVETQLLSWLQKYDVDMTDKQHEVDVLRVRFDEEVELCEKWTKKIEEQELIYAPLIKERDDEYHEEMKKKMTEFQLDHAARVIQNAWKQVLANRTEKRKLKRQLKKVKAERDRLQRIADRKEVQARKDAAKTEKAAKKAAKEALRSRKVED